MYFIPKTTQLIFGGLNINNKQCSTFTFMYLVSTEPQVMQNSMNASDIYAQRSNKKTGRDVFFHSQIFVSHPILIKIFFLFFCAKTKFQAIKAFFSFCNSLCKKMRKFQSEDRFTCIQLKLSLFFNYEIKIYKNTKFLLLNYSLMQLQHYNPGVNPTKLFFFLK